MMYAYARIRGIQRRAETTHDSEEALLASIGAADLRLDADQELALARHLLKVAASSKSY